jgi:hypothetical protein
VVLMGRGQAAIEYLIILAVVVIIALIVIGVIGGFPGMTRGVSERDSAAYWAGADVGVTRYFVSTTTSCGGQSCSQIVVRNNRLFAVNLTQITLDGSMVNYSTGVNIAPGSTYVLNLTSNGTCGSGTSGMSYSKNVVVTYKDATYGTTYTFTGEKPLVGTCQT